MKKTIHQSVLFCLPKLNRNKASFYCSTASHLWPCQYQGSWWTDGYWWLTVSIKESKLKHFRSLYSSEITLKRPELSEHIAYVGSKGRFDSRHVLLAWGFEWHVNGSIASQKKEVWSAALISAVTIDCITEVDVASESEKSSQCKVP